MLSDRVYTWMKWICVIFLPATATFVFSLGSIFSWDWAGTVVGVITAVDTFLGTLIGISTAQYNAKKGENDVE